MRPTALLLIAGVLAAPRAVAQERHQEEHGEHGEHRMSEDAHAVALVVHQLFDAMRAKDTTAMRGIFHPSARLQRTGPNRGGELEIGNLPIDRFIQTIGGSDAYLDEQIWDVEVRVDGDLATVWDKYAFYVNEQFSHCGVDAFQLGRLAAGWKIFQISHTQRREGCEIPPADAERHQ